MEELIEKYKGVPAIDAARAMSGLRATKDELEERLKEVNIEYDFLRLTHLPEQLENEGIQNIKVEGVGKVTLRGDVYVSVLAENREEFHGWLRDTGRGDLIKDSVNASTLKAAAKQWLKAGEVIPETLVKITPYTQAVITKG